MKVTAFIGSAVKDGNVAAMCTALLSGAKSAGHTTEAVYLSDYTIQPCQGCFSCSGNKHCIITDDFNSLFEKCAASDVIVLGTPVYFGNVSGLMKNFMDRHNGNGMYNPPEMADLPAMPKKDRMKLFFSKIAKEYQPVKEMSGKRYIRIITANKPLFLLLLKGELKTVKNGLSFFIHEMKGKILGSLVYGGTNTAPEKKTAMMHRAEKLGKKL